jgi:hypothetical protein
MPIDYSEYPPNWKTEIRPRIIARAGNCCEECKVKNHSIILREANGTWRYISPTECDWIKAKMRNGYNEAGALKKMGFTKVVLTIAHLNHDKLNWDVKDDELKALCQRCHLLLDIKHHTANRKYGRNHKREAQMKLL